jgi:RNA polymerase sigma factor (sigma-70 family)
MMVVCLRYSKNREEAEEVLQEGFLKVFDKISQFKGEGSFEGWIRKIMVNCALQRYRSTKTLQPLLNLEAVKQDFSGDDEIGSHVSVKELIKLVQQLTPMYKMVFNLYVFEGMKHREIAALLDISEGTSKSNLSDARVILQRAVNNSLKIAKLT